MLGFFASFTLNEGITLTISLIAIGISLLTFFNDNKKNRRELRISKLEEILEMNIYFLNHYSFLLEIVEFRDNVKFNQESNSMSVIDSDIRGDLLSKEFLDIVGLNNFDKNLTRLNVLANSYLPKDELKYKCISIVDLIANLYNYTVYKIYEVRTNYPKFPTKEDYFDYIEELEKDLIAEMKLGYESAKDMDRINYLPNFKKDLKIN